MMRRERVVACTFMAALAFSACRWPDTQAPSVPAAGPRPPDLASWGPEAPARSALPRDALEALAALDGFVRQRERQDDFSGFHEAHHAVQWATPRSESEVRLLLQLADEADLSVRVVGRAHSMSGRAIGQPGELVVSTGGLRRICRVSDHAVEAATGPRVLAIEDFLRAHGLSLPVVNDGKGGPSLGGYLSAGGFGAGSSTFGGFWQVVEAVTLVDAGGDVHAFTPSDDTFGWLFGSAGQLGVVTRVTLRVIVTDTERAAAWPVGRCAEVPDAVEPVPDHVSEAARRDRLAWWSVFVRPEDAQAVAQELAHIREKHASPHFRWIEDYRYALAEGPVRAPLVHALEGTVIVRGIWGLPTDPSTDRHRPVVETIEADVDAWAAGRGLRRYLGAELSQGPDVYARQLGPDLLAEFRRLKERFDPEHRFGRGVVFAVMDGEEVP